MTPHYDHSTGAPGVRPRILLVDDDVDTARILGRCLSLRYDVVLASDGMEGLEIALQLPRPHLVISDVSMPRADGITMARKIRAALPPGLRPLVMFLTGRGEVMDVIAGIQAGARHYLTKPVDLTDLERKVNRALAGVHR